MQKKVKALICFIFIASLGLQAMDSSSSSQELLEISTDAEDDEVQWLDNNVNPEMCAYAKDAGRHYVNGRISAMTEHIQAQITNLRKHLNYKSDFLRANPSNAAIKKSNASYRNELKVLLETCTGEYFKTAYLTKDSLNNESLELFLKSFRDEQGDCFKWSEKSCLLISDLFSPTLVITSALWIFLDCCVFSVGPSIAWMGYSGLICVTCYCIPRLSAMLYGKTQRRQIEKWFADDPGDHSGIRALILSEAKTYADNTDIDEHFANTKTLLTIELEAAPPETAEQPNEIK